MMEAKPEPFFMTRDGAFKVIAEMSDGIATITVYSWSENFGKAGDWLPIIQTQDSQELERHFPEGSLHEFEVPDYPPDGMVSA